MTPAPAHRVRALSIHAGYQCRHAGACCTSGWDIPVEPETEERLRAALRSGSLRSGSLRSGSLRSGSLRSGSLRPAEPDGIRPDDGALLAGLAGESGPSDRCFRGVTGLSHGARAILRTNRAGECVFLDPRRARSGSCTVHRDIGEPALPSACRHFPRVVTLTPLGVSVTLSHYCPTAAGMLFASPSAHRQPEARPGLVIPSPDPRGTRVALSNDLSCRALPGDASDSASAPREGPGEGPLFISRSSVPPGDEESAGPPSTHDPPLRIVEDPPAFPAEWPWEGLDARDALPPLLRPGVLMDWPSLERWEHFAISVLAEDDRSPEAALDVLASAAEKARRWTPVRGPFGMFFEGTLASSPRMRTGRPPAALAPDRSPRGDPSLSGDEPRRNAHRPPGQGAGGTADSSGPVLPESLGMTGAWQLVADTVPHCATALAAQGAPQGDLLPPAPEGLVEADERWVAPAWPALAPPVRRWLAARAFASWIALQGEGLRTMVAFLYVALGVLRAEAARGRSEADRPLDAALLQEAVRRADLLLLHLADPEALARRISRNEAAEGPTAAW